MKHFYISFFLTVLMSMVGEKAYAYDISIANEDGVVIYYNLINNEQELEVTYKAKYDYSGTTNYSGYTDVSTIIIPEEVSYMDTNKKVTSIGEHAFSKSSLTSVSIPNTVTTIKEAAFANCNGLSSITIPNSVTTIGESAFYYCYGLTSVTIGNSVTSIERTAFCGCKYMTSLTLGNSVTSIGPRAFQYCNALASLTIPSSVKIIDSGAFNINSCKFEEINCFIEAPDDISTSAFSSEIYNNVLLNVPIGTKYRYKACKGWQNFLTIEEQTNVTEPSEEPNESCTTPTISLKNGQIIFDCETEGVEFISEITSSDMGSRNYPIIPLSYIYKVSVYAQKEGYKNSEVATAYFDIRGLQGDVNRDGVVTIADAVTVVNIILNGGEATAPPALSEPEEAGQVPE